MQRAAVLRVGVTIKQIEKNICKICLFFEFESFGGAQKTGGALPPNYPHGYGPEHL